jgi:hypothetical protein
MDEMEVLLKRMANADPEILEQYKQQQRIFNFCRNNSM